MSNLTNIKHLKEINKILKIYKIKLLPIEIRYLDALLELAESGKKLIIYGGRQPSRSLSKVDLIYSMYSNRAEYKTNHKRKKYDFASNMIIDEVHEWRPNEKK